MILKNSLYKVLHKETDATATTYSVELDSEHFIFKAHFPGQPIMPGVCIVQMVKELLEDCLGKSFRISRIKNVKFLSAISPLETSSLLCRLAKLEECAAEKTVKVQATICTATEQKAKVSLVCTAEA